ncbi:hypothetical protein [Streptomyces zaomyceticus]|uniref:hypothetical protein n=1 Tax=Streptomyces zaomyceticus TaxID=68286 RepID=UPI0036C90FD1
MVDIVEIYVHWYAGRSKSQLALSLRLDRKTVRNYLVQNRPTNFRFIHALPALSASGGTCTRGDQRLVSDADPSAPRPLPAGRAPTPSPCQA